MTFVVDYYEAVQLHGLDGIVIKDLNSRYKLDTRSPSWQKVINWTETEVFFGLLIEPLAGLLELMGIEQVIKEQRHTGISPV